MPSTLTKRVNLLLLLLLLADLVYSVMQFYQSTLDGDMALIILPSPPWRQVLADPLAWHALVDKEVYAGTNRFVPHWCLERFYKTVPFILQRFVDPLTSIYLTGAIAKMIIQAALIYLMSLFVSGTGKIMERKFLLAALVITPLFQTFGYSNEIGIIDGSVTYAFFYGLATVCLLLFFLPFYLHYVHRKPLPANRWLILLMIPLAWIVAFNGPLNAPVLLLICPVLVLCLMYGTARILQTQDAHVNMTFARTPGILVIGIFAGIIFAALSYYAGKFNIENVAQPEVSIRARYMLLPKGFIDFFTARPLPLLMATITLGISVMNILKVPGRRDINRLAVWFLIFSAIFIILLPLGGYRSYRPLIVRRDLMQPVLIGLFILYAVTALHLVRHLKGGKKLLYLGLLVYVGFHLTKVDRLHRGHHACEKEALQTIASAPGNIVLTDSSCTVMAWGKITDPHESRFNAQLLTYWHVFPKVKYYFQK